MRGYEYTSQEKYLWVKMFEYYGILDINDMLDSDYIEELLEIYYMENISIDFLVQTRMISKY